MRGRSSTSTPNSERRRHRLPDRHRLPLSLRVDRRVRAVLDRPLGRTVRCLADEDAVHRRRALEAGGRVDHVAGDEPFARLGTRVNGDERLARVHCEPHLNARPRRRPSRESRAPRARRARVVLVHGRRPEHGDDRIADELLDRAATPLELLAYSRVKRRQLGAHILGIEPLRPRRRSDEVAEDDAHDLPLLHLRLRRRRAGGHTPSRTWRRLAFSVPHDGQTITLQSVRPKRSTRSARRKPRTPNHKPRT